MWCRNSTRHGNRNRWNWGINLQPQPPHSNARQKYEQRYGRKTVDRVCLVLKHFGPYVVRIFVHIFALYVGGGGHSHVSEEPLFQEPTAEPELLEQLSKNRNRNRPLLSNCAETKKSSSTWRNGWNRKPEPLKPFHPQTITEQRTVHTSLLLAIGLLRQECIMGGHPSLVEDAKAITILPAFSSPMVMSK